MPLVYHDGVVSELRHREVWYGVKIFKKVPECRWCITTVWYLSYGTVKFGTEQHTASTCRVECTLKMEAQCPSGQNVFYRQQSPMFDNSADAVSSTVYAKIQ